MSSTKSQTNDIAVKHVWIALHCIVSKEEEGL
jgi:hypothetical protein